MLKNKKLNLPIGIRYIQGFLLIQIGFYLILISSLLSVVFSNLNIFTLLIVLFLLAPIFLLIMIFRGLSKIKHWAWILAIVNFGMFAIYNMTKTSLKTFVVNLNDFFFSSQYIVESGLIWVLISVLSCWYLYRRKAFYKVGRLPNIKRCLKEERILKYLFWIFVMIILLYVILYLFGWYILLGFH